VGAAAGVGAGAGAGAGGVAGAGAGVGAGGAAAIVGPGTGGLAAAAGADVAAGALASPAPPCSFFSSSTLRESSATRCVWAFCSVALETCDSPGVPGLTPPCDRVRRSGVVLAAAFLSST
jgi:hypothetical protein